MLKSFKLKPPKLLFLTFGIGIVLIFIDQFTKYLAKKHLSPNKSIKVIFTENIELINFTYAENRGAAFSILSGKQFFLIGVTGILLLGIIIYLLSGKVKSKFQICAFSLIAVGGIGNLIDRIANRYVVDFIEFGFFNFAIFNFADICAVTGTAMLFLAFLLEIIHGEKNESKRNKPSS